ncbi:unnamed protein product [Durusdinium trenchii]|uniref:Uncharacterized protein n=1 Tax=Durusdinium trenchii TaxID=1381693 RepID=A0ABP0HHQ4_9DINO
MKKFPSAIFTSQGQNSCVMHCIACHAHCSFALAYRKAQPLAVAHPLLQLQDGDTFKQIGNAFQVKGELANVDDLKKAIDPSLPPIQTSKIDVYSLKDGSWIREEKMSASLRDTDETDCYGFTLPSA